MRHDEIAYLSATELIAAYRARDLSPVEVTEATLERIDDAEKLLNAFAVVTDELARAQAKTAEEAYLRGEAGPLAGVPITIKDVTWTKGIRTGMGSLIYKDHVPAEDAPFVERVRDAGAVLLGKTTTPEFGWKGETSSPLTGTTRNPWNLERTPGGSSGGASAAVAAGLGPLAHGSDGAGSIRIPASFAGVYGLKPSYGLIPIYPPSGVGDLAHWGPITRTVRDAALLTSVTAVADPRDRTSWSSGVDCLAALNEQLPRGMRIAWSADLGYTMIDPEVRGLAERAAKTLADTLGAELIEDHPPMDDPWPIEDVIWSAAMAALHADNLDEVRHLIDPGRLAVVETGLRYTAADVLVAARRRAAYYDGWRRFMERYDLLLTPTLPCTAFPVGQDHPGTIAGKEVGYLRWTGLTYPFNLTGQPAATCPCGFATDGLPVGLQIVGRWHDDATVLRASLAFEAAMPWTQHRPQLA